MAEYLLCESAWLPVKSNLSELIHQGSGLFVETLEGRVAHFPAPGKLVDKQLRVRPNFDREVIRTLVTGFELTQHSAQRADQCLILGDVVCREAGIADLDRSSGGGAGEDKRAIATARVTDSPAVENQQDIAAWWRWRTRPDASILDGFHTPSGRPRYGLEIDFNQTTPTLPRGPCAAE